MPAADASKKWRPDTTGVRSAAQMGRPRKPTTKDDQPLNIGFRVPPDLLQAVDAEVARMSSEQRGLKLSRTQAVIILLWEALEARQKNRPGK